MSPSTSVSLGVLAVCLGLLTPSRAARAEEGDCLVWAQPDSSKRPGGGLHKIKIRMPDAMARDEASLKHVAAGLASVGARVLFEYGAGSGFPFFVQATDSQLDALAARLTRLYQNPVEQVRAWFQYADDVDVLESVGLGLIVDTGRTRPDQLPVPRGWTLAAGPEQPVYWLVHFAAPMFGDSPWLASLQHAPALASPAPVVLVDWNATTAVVRMSAVQAGQVRRLPGVDWVGRYEAALKLGRSLGPLSGCLEGRAGAARLLRSAEALPEEEVELVVGLFESNPKLSKAIIAQGGAVSEGGEDMLIVKGPRRLIRWLARRVEVRFLDVAATGGPAVDGLGSPVSAPRAPHSPSKESEF
ncbi:hypothetical protein CYFUS_008920 [Cystobacter fuscus]|uniref:DUF2066 domain-containing protein n=1 Tax=Cystobacter fuscus TaxID=43 RepID=A0A250JII6_9BACT|nr:hypothetical protein CYFUS_008920 [Cystobacter fuscus]